MQEIGVGKIASISGRYYAMDRDNNWDRIQKAYDSLVSGTGVQATDAVKAMETSYADGVTDEFVLPTVITDEAGKPVSVVKENDHLKVSIETENTTYNKIYIGSKADTVERKEEKAIVGTGTGNGYLFFI